jgi:hypothetical protein
MMDVCGSALPANPAALLRMQFEIAWSLAWYHLETLTTEECMWRPAPTCLHISQDEAGSWRADWPEREDYDIGPPSIGWTTWHMCFWWRKALAHIRASSELERDDIRWPGSAERLRVELIQCKDEWLEVLNGPAQTLEAVPANSWPLPGASVAAIAAWLNIELAKNAAEVGLIRFLHRVTP